MIARRRAVALTPLIDVIFLLLLFFMLTASFTREAEVALPGGGGAPGGAAPAFLQVSPGGLRLDRAPVTLAGLAPALRAARPGAVVVAFAPGTDAQRLVDVVLVLAGVPDLPVALLERADGR